MGVGKIWERYTREVRRKKSRGEGNPIRIQETEYDCIVVFLAELK